MILSDDVAFIGYIGIFVVIVLLLDWLLQEFWKYARKKVSELWKNQK